MKCNHCRKNEATVHLVEMAGGRRRELWLCGECAEAEQWRRLDSMGGPARNAPIDSGTRGPGPASGDHDAMLRFLGQLSPEAGHLMPDKVCSHCGQSWVAFQESGQLGCAQCYTVFGTMLLPLLTSFHRHAVHLGRTPGSRTEGVNDLAEILRLRVGLEKAIAAEEFEQAARLRDQLRTLEDRRHQEDSGE